MFYLYLDIIRKRPLRLVRLIFEFSFIMPAFLIYIEEKDRGLCKDFSSVLWSTLVCFTNLGMTDSTVSSLPISYSYLGIVSISGTLITALLASILLVNVSNTVGLGRINCEHSILAL